MIGLGVSPYFRKTFDNLIPPPISGYSIWYRSDGLVPGSDNQYGICDGTNAISLLRNLKGSSSNYSEQLVGINQPILNTSVFGTRKGIQTSSFDWFVQNNLGISNGISGCTIYTNAWVSTGGAQRVLFFLSTGTSAGNARIQIDSDASNNWRIAARRLDADGASLLTGGSTLTKKRMAFVIDYANSDAFIYEAGSLTHSNTSFGTAGSTSATNSLSGFIGRNNTGNGFIGEFGDLLFYPSAHNSSWVAIVDSWLANFYV